MDLHYISSFVFPIWLQWMIFFAVRIAWHLCAQALLRDRSLLAHLSAKLPPLDPATPFLLAYMRDGVRAAAELAVYASLRRGIIRFAQDASVEVIQANETSPTPHEQCALAWAVAHHGRRPDPTPYWEHPAFLPLTTLGDMVRERGLGGAIRLSEKNRKRTHRVAAGLLVLGAGVATWVGLQGASNYVVIGILVSGVLQYLWCRTDERMAEPTSALLLAHITSTVPEPLAQAGQGQPMRWHELMFAAGLQGVPAVWSARLQMRGADDRPITTGPPDRWFDDTAARLPVVPDWRSSNDAADGSH